MNSQVKPEPIPKFGLAAFEAFLRELELAQIPVEKLDYASLPKADPPVDTAVEFFSQYVGKMGTISEDRKTQLLDKVKELAKVHPVTSSGEQEEGKLREGTIIIEDLATFKQSLEKVKPTTSNISLEEKVLSSKRAHSKQDNQGS